MPVVSIMYPRGADTTFDHDYYTQTHMPLVERSWSTMGLEKATLMKGVPGPDGAQPGYEMIALLQFSSMDAFGAAAKAHGKEIFADIANFTNTKPVVQFNEAV